MREAVGIAKAAQTQVKAMQVVVNKVRFYFSVSVALPTNTENAIHLCNSCQVQPLEKRVDGLASELANVNTSLSKATETLQV